MSNSVILVTGSYDHSMIFWDAYEGKQQYHYEYPQDQVLNRLEVSFDKKYLGAAFNNSAKVYDISQIHSTENIVKVYTQIYKFDSYKNNVTSIGFQKDGNFIYTSSEDGSIKMWDLRAQGFQRNYQNKDPVNCVVLHPNDVFDLIQGEIIAADQSGNIKIFDLVADKCRANINISEYGVRSLSIAKNAQYLVAADSNGSCHVWTLKNIEELVPFQKFDAHGDYILRCLVSNDLRFMATCSADKTTKLWTLVQDKGYQLHKTLYGKKINKGHQKWVWDAAFSCDSDYLITASTDTQAMIWYTETGELVRTLKGHKKGYVLYFRNQLYSHA